MKYQNMLNDANDEFFLAANAADAHVSWVNGSDGHPFFFLI